VERLRQDVIVEADGRIVVYVPQLKPGTRAEVIVTECPAEAGDPAQRVRLSSLIGACRGMFASPDEADDFLRRERDAWDS
jgi:hypothetical protein